jgi:hypothetical protein
MPQEQKQEHLDLSCRCRWCAHLPCCQAHSEYGTQHLPTSFPASLTTASKISACHLTPAYTQEVSTMQ